MHNRSEYRKSDECTVMQCDNIYIYMSEKLDIAKTKVNVKSEYGHLNAVLLHRPGIEIERMTPMTAADALYSDILCKHIVDNEYANFSGVFEKWTQVYYVEDLLAQLLDNATIRQQMIVDCCLLDDCMFLEDYLLQMPSRQLAKGLIEGVEYREGIDPKQFAESRYTLKPLYNLFFTRDASSSMYNEVLINSMSFKVRQRETVIYRAIFQHIFGANLVCAMDADVEARTEGGDVQIAGPDFLCIGQGIRTNPKGIQFLAEKFAKERPQFRILTQELPHHPDSFIHLDMVHTFLGAHDLMVYKPMIDKTGLFAGKATTLITCDNGKITYKEMPNMLEGLKACGMEMQPVFCGGGDFWYQDRDQWHSGANFFALDDGKIIGYERNQHTIEALNKAGFEVLAAEDVCSGKVDMHEHKKFVVTFKASELPRGGGGARCMTMPINRD